MGKIAEKIPFEIELEMVEKAFGKTFLEDLHKLDLKTGGDKTDITENFILKFIEERFGKDRFEKSKDAFSSPFMNQLFHMYHFHKYGKKVFRFEEKLTSMLMKTELKNVNTDFVKLPFHSIYIQVPLGTFIKEIDGHNHALLGVYVYDLPTDFLERELLDTELGKNITKLIRIQALFSQIDEGSNGEIQFSSVNLRFKPGNLFEQLEENYKRIGLDKSGMELSDEIISFVVNAIFYLNSDKRVIELVEPEFHKLILGKKSSKKKKKLERKYENYTSIPYYLVGKTVTIDNKLEKTSNIINAKEEPQRVYHTQWIVRGHWRNQPCGEGLKERKLVWIKPYIKGNENAPIVDKDYYVK